jgi:drug/metabolite transporter (DMT)-like permease
MDDKRGTQIFGASLMAASVVMFVIMNALTKYSGIPSAEKVFFRMIVGVFTIFTMVRAGFVKMEFNNVKVLALRGFLGACAVLFYFHSIDHTTLGRAVFFQFTYLAWGALFSYFFLKEPLGWKRLPAVAATFAGGYVILLSDTGFSFAAMKSGDISGVLCGLFSGAAVTAIRASHRQDSTFMIFLFFASFGTAAGAVATFAGGGFVEPVRWEWLVLFAIGATGTVGQLFFTAGYRHLDVAAAGSIAMAQAPASAVAGFLFFEEKLAAGFALGAALVLAGGIYLASSSGGAVVRGAPVPQPPSE